MSAKLIRESDFCGRLAEAKPGDVISYHVGDLAFDREKTVSLLTEHEMQEIRAVADLAYQMARDGFAHLLQRRVATGVFEYLLVVRPAFCRHRTIRA